MTSVRPRTLPVLPRGSRHAWWMWGSNAVGVFVVVGAMVLSGAFAPGNAIAVYTSLLMIWWPAALLFPGRQRLMMCAITLAANGVFLALMGAWLHASALSVVIALIASTIEAGLSLALVWWWRGPICRAAVSASDLAIALAGSVIGTAVAMPLWSYASIFDVAPEMTSMALRILQAAAGGFVGLVASGLLWFRPLGPDVRRTNWVEFIVMTAIGAAGMVLVFGYLSPAWSWAVLVPAVWVGMRVPPAPVALYTVVITVFAITTQLFLGMARVGESQGRELVILGASSCFALVALLLTIMNEQSRVLTAELLEQRSEADRRAQMLDLTFDTMTDGVIVIDGETGLESYNRGAVRLLGRDFLATPVSEWPLSGDIDPERLFSGLTQTLRRDSPVPNEDGDPMSLAIEVAGLVADGHRKAVLIVRDVTAEEQRMAELTQFAAVAAHDLKAPMTGLRGWLEIAVTEFREDPTMSEAAMSHALAATERMNAQIDGWLTYNVARRGTMDTVPVQLADIAYEFAANHPEGDYEIELHQPVVGDPALLRQLMENLLGNAVKYTREGETPRIRVLGRLIDADWLEIEVADSGIGIPEGMEDAVFDRFTRGDNTESRHGLGMGLSLCRQIVRRHGGEIRAERRTSGGTRILFSLPLARAAGRQPSGHEPTLLDPKATIGAGASAGARPPADPESQAAGSQGFGEQRSVGVR